MRPFVERLKSRKLIMALVAAAVAGTKMYYPDLPEDAVYAIVGACMGYVAVEGAVDAVGQLAKWLAEKNKTEPLVKK
ncbi:hypothetical protein [Desulfotomaculum sp. 1211_IL3151]|uniref:hypothetical protein n=1 Tax=Desulfotomaculum sp. 1211_IL3151 TaxID=3084055 RepID=UPI002FDA8932